MYSNWQYQKLVRGKQNTSFGNEKPRNSYFTLHIRNGLSWCWIYQKGGTLCSALRVWTVDGAGWSLFVQKLFKNWLCPLFTFFHHASTSSCTPRVYKLWKTSPFLLSSCVEIGIGASQSWQWHHILVLSLMFGGMNDIPAFLWAYSRHCICNTNYVLNNS